MRDSQREREALGEDRLGKRQREGQTWGQSEKKRQGERNKDRAKEKAESLKNFTCKSPRKLETTYCVLYLVWRKHLTERCWGEQMGGRTDGGWRVGRMAGW